LVRFAGKARLPERLVLDTATETVARFYESWTELKGDLPLPRNTIDAIDGQLKRIPIAQTVFRSLD